MKRSMRIPKHFFSHYFTDMEHVLLAKPHTRHRFSKGEILFYDVYKENVYYYIKQGQCMVYGLSEEGSQKLLCYYADGVFTNLAIGDEIDSIYNCELIEAMSDVEVIMFSKNVILELLQENFEFVKRMLVFTNDLLVLLSYHSLTLAYLPSETKLCDYLYMCYEYYPSVQTKEGKTINICQVQIASYIGVTRTQVSRIIKRLRDQSLIDTNRGRICIKQPEKLLLKCTKVINCNMSA